MNDKGIPKDYLNTKGHELLDKLLNQRFFGKYKHDLDGFMEQMKLIKNNHCGKGTPASVRGI